MRELTVRRLNLAVAAVLTTAISAGAEPAPAGAAKRAFAVADFYRLRPVLEPVISPDGRTIVYTVTSRDLEHAKQTVHLWRVDADGIHARALTGGDTTNQQHVPSRLIVYERAGHWPSWHEMALYYAAHLDWFHRWLGGAAAPWDPKEIVDGAGVPARPPAER